MNLVEGGVEITALHNHLLRSSPATMHSNMLEEQPRLFFMHFWTNDDAQELAGGLKAALSKVSLAK
jgi:hypothetical protein